MLVVRASADVGARAVFLDPTTPIKLRGSDGGRLWLLKPPPPGGGVRTPGAGRIELDIGLPMLAGFRGRAEPVTDKSEIVVSVGMAGIEAHGDAQMLARSLQLPELLKDAAEVEMGDGVILVNSHGAEERTSSR